MQDSAFLKLEHIVKNKKRFWKEILVEKRVKNTFYAEDMSYKKYSFPNFRIITVPKKSIY